MSNKFELSSNEKLYKEGAVSMIKSMLNVTPCHMYLTSERIVVCSKGLFSFVFGPLIALFYKPTAISTEISLRDLATVTREKHGLASKYVFRTNGGAEVSLQFALGAEKWLEAVVAGKEASSASISTKKIGDMIEFKMAA